MRNVFQESQQSNLKKSLLDRSVIWAGNQFFRYRNAIFPVIFALALLLLRPRVILANPRLDHWLVVCGTTVVLVAESFRLMTIGFDYISRGGNFGQISASFLVQKGVYGLTRNPMYFGNMFIAIGMVMVAGSPFMYGLLLPFFMFVYWSMVRAEEAYLLQRFGSEYAQYCARVNRFVPSLCGAQSAFAGMRFNWGRAFRKELSTLAWLLAALILLPVWRVYWLQGWIATKAAAPRALILTSCDLFLYGFFHHLKARRQFFYSQD